VGEKVWGNKDYGKVESLDEFQGELIKEKGNGTSLRWSRQAR
jgi:hypothetical protein